MSLQGLHKKTTISRSKSSEKAKKINSNLPIVNTLDISSNKISIKDKQKLSTIKSHIVNKKKTLLDKSKSCNKNTSISKLSPKSAIGSTLKENNVSPFYNKLSAEMFHKLWLPPKTDSLILNSISLNGTSLNSTVKYTLYKESNNIPLNKNYLKTCYQLLHSSQQNIMKNVDTPLNKDTFTGLKNKCSSDLIRTRKIRIFPNEEHINFYKSCFGASRFLYNRLIYSFKKESNDYLDSLKKSAKKKGCIKVVKMKSESLNNKSRTSGSKTTKKPLIVKCCKKVKGDYFCKDHIESKIPYKINTSFIYWRNKLILKKSNLPEEDLWLGNIPYDTRQLVIKNAMGGIKSALTKVKKGDIKGFDLKYKRKKNINSEIFNVDHRALIYKEHKNGFFLFQTIINF